ncbi:PPE-repeat proteins [Mycobacterium basiliense]|uniref:PPE-repeat proteins n=1 Tax=Mycobacterium basiliense TaxID=2094119 RepID=A0A3S5CZX9_9MYCO|nr:PecA family PE domain-processing aspartic protease [Mycobacterium basiliense]VDM89745.1 PPE-repeat proteins [Mycobacterium basiliense]
MSFVSVAPELVATATADLAGIGSAIGAANAAAAVATTTVLPSAADEVSAAIAAFLANYARQYRVLAGQVETLVEQFTRDILVGTKSYVAAESANLERLVWGMASGPADLVNEPVRELTGRPMIGNGANGYTNSEGIGTSGGAGGWLYGNGGTGGISTRAGVPGGTGGNGGLLIGNGGTGGISLYGGAPGGAGGAAGLIGDGGTGGASGPGGVAGIGGHAGLLWGQTGAPGVNTPLTANQTLLYVDQYGNPLINISVGGGPSMPVIVDSGSTGLLIPPQYVNLAALGPPTGTGSVSYGLSDTGRLNIEYQTFQTTVNYGNGIVSPSTTVGVATSAWLGDPSNTIPVSSLPAYLGIGPNNQFPFGTPTNAALPVNMNQGVLIDMPRGLLEFGPNSQPPIVQLNGAPGTVLQVQIDDQPVQTINAYIDSGGVHGSIPQSLVPGLAVGNHLPEGTTITVYTINGVKLYSQTVTAASSPLVVSSNNVFNTGNYPFSVGPIYIWNEPSPVGTTVFDRLA